jgi:hypothetical protein
MAHVIKLSVDSYRRITAVDIAPTQVQVVGGRNGQGKTSLLDAICVALFGPKWDATTEPIHEGSNTATIVVGLDDVAGHGPLTVTRTYRTGKAGAVTTKVEVTRPDGSTLSAPQTVLDELIGRLGANPGEFLALPEKQQRAAVLKLVDLPFDLDALEAERRALYDDRTVVGRDVAAAKALVAAETDPGPGETEPISVADAAKAWADAVAANTAAAAHQGRVERSADALAHSAARVADLETQLAAAKAELAAAGTAHQLLIDERPETVDEQPLADQVRDLEAINRDRAARARYQLLVATADDLVRHQTSLTAQINEIDRRKDEALQAAVMPAPGLTITEAGIDLNGHPFTQASQAERLRVALAIAAAADPTVRVAVIRDASLFDDDSLAAIAEWATANDYQVFLEVVGDAGGVVIEDGAVKAVS